MSHCLAKLARAMELLRTSVALRTSVGLNKVPALAKWLADEFKQGVPQRVFTSLQQMILPY
jgi:hypothetical protein